VKSAIVLTHTSIILIRPTAYLPLQSVKNFAASAAFGMQHQKAMGSSDQNEFRFRHPFTCL
jgi:hypothetical protein